MSAQRIGRSVRWPFWVILGAGCFFLVAEVFAIGAAISGDPSDAARVLVSVALIAAAAGAVLLVVLSWVEKVEPGRRSGPLVVLVVALAGISVFAVLALIDAVQDAGRARDQQENLAAWDRLLAQQRSLFAQQRRLERERTALLLRLGGLRRGDPSARGKRFFIEQQIRSVNFQLKTVQDALQTLGRDSEQLNEESERLEGASS